jgi:phosphonate transport system substrate-binding protein
MNTKMTRCALALILSVGGLSSSWAAAYSFAIAPQQSREEIMRRWAPIVQHVAQTTGVELELTTGSDIPSYQNEIKNGKFDFAFVNAYHYTLFHESVGYDAFARQQGADTVGIIVVRKDSPIKSVADLQGLTVAFPAPTAIAATVLQLSYLNSQKVEVRPTYMTTMDNVYSAVARGLHPAGGGEMRTFESMDSTMRNDLRILWTAPALPAHPFFAHPRVPKEVVAKVQKAMVELGTTDSGKHLLRAVRFKGIEATSDADYNDVRSLHLSIPKAP